MNDTILRLVCFAQCDSCLLTGTVEKEINELTLEQNFPNPFSEVTTISYRIQYDGRMKLSVYTPMGQPVAVLFDGTCRPGAYHLPFQSNHLAAGIYCYQMIFTGDRGTQILSKKMIVK